MEFYTIIILKLFLYYFLFFNISNALNSAAYRSQFD